LRAAPALTENPAVPLSLDSRRVGDLTVITCAGRLVEGAETAALQKRLDDVIPRCPRILLHLGSVDFVDSSGLGLLVRYLTRTRNGHGSLKLCAVPEKLDEILRITRLRPMFDAYASEAEAIAAFYQRTDTAEATKPLRRDVLIVDRSADVQAYIRELLAQAGYGVLTAGNLPDALILMQATGPKLVIVAAELRMTRGTPSAEKFNRLADAMTVIELPTGFAGHDAGEAGRLVLDQVRAVVGVGGSPAA
jgi:anti-sigma B factor antagonist